MSNRQQESDLYNYFDKKEDNGSSQEDLYFQSQTSENMSLEENSDHDETPNAVKSYETHKLTIKNELTQKQRTNYTSIGNGFSVENNSRHQAREIKLLGKKTSEPDIQELNMEQVIETVIEALTNGIQFLKAISSNFYGVNLDFTINKDLISQKGFFEKNLDKTIKEIFLEMKDIDPQEKESLKTKIKSLLELESEQKDKFLPYCKKLFKMNLKGLLSNYINDRSDKICVLNKFKFKTLEDNPKYSEEEKMGIRKQINTYLESQKEQTSCINNLLIDQNQLIKHDLFYHELNFNQVLPNLIQLPNDDINEENLSPENIDSVNHIENNQAGNYIENNEAENNIENNEIENNIENNEIENNIENNQTENNNNLITENHEPNEQKGGRIDNLKRLSVKESFNSFTEMIEEIANVKLNKVFIDKDINGNSTEKFRKFFKREIGEIIGSTNGDFVKSIVNSNDTSKEIIFLKNLFKKEYFHIIEIFINDIPFSFTKSNGDIVKFKTIEDVTIEKITNNIIKIKVKMNKVLQSKERLRKKLIKINDC
jgi:hypothetical protein